MALGQKYSFITDAPLAKNYVGEALTETENQGFKYRAEQRLAEAKKKEEEDAIDKENAVVLGRLKNPTTTKFSTQNALTIDGANKLFNGVAEKARELKNGKISKLDYDIYKANAMGQIDLMNQANKRINEQGEEYAKQLADGKISPVFADNALNFGKAFQENNIHFELNSDGTLKAFAYDDPTNPTKIIEKGDLSTFGNFSFSPISNYDIDKDITEFKKTYPPVLTEKLGYNTKTGVKGLTPQIEKAIDLKVNSLIADKNSLAVANAQRPGGSVNPDVTNSSDIESTKKFLTERYLNAYSPETTIDEATGRASEARQGRAGNKEEPIIKPVVGDYRSPIVMNIDGKPVTRPLKSVYKNNLSFKKDEFKLESVGGKYNDVNVETIGLNAKGVPFMTGTYATQKGSTSGTNVQVASESTREGIKQERFFYDFGPTELNSVAQKMGYKNGDELTAEVRRINNYKAKSKQQTKSKPNNNDPLGIL